VEVGRADGVWVGVALEGAYVRSVGVVEGAESEGESDGEESVGVAEG